MKFVKRVLIIGGPGTGKTTVIKSLHSLGYATIDEAARKIIQHSLAIQSDILPWGNRDKFDFEVYSIMADDYKSLNEGTIAFFDGGLLDILAWRKYLKKDTSIYEHIAYSCPYHKIAFSPVPWKEIYVSDRIRPMDFETSSRINDFIVSYYRDSGYKVVLLDKSSPLKRAKLILSHFD